MSRYLTDFISDHTKHIPNKTAVVFDNNSTSFSELNNYSISLANDLYKRLPKNKQNIIGMLFDNSIEFIICYVAIVMSGNIAMPLDPNYKRDEIKSILSGLKPELTIVSEDLKKLLPRNAKTFAYQLSVNINERTNPENYHRTSPDKQVVSMLFTSGTTGNPKATPYTHTNHIWNVSTLSKLWEWTSEDTILLSLPLSHWHGLCLGLGGMLIHGNTIHLQNRFDPDSTIQALSTGDISMFMHVPAAYQKMVEHESKTKPDFSKVRLFTSGSSFLPPELWNNFKDKYGVEILERYGASEMGIVTSNTLDNKLAGHVGSPLPDVELKILSDGQVGMKSPGLFPGYWKNFGATKKNFTKDGYWKSGDIGVINNNSVLQLKGRVQEKMKKFGYTVYPRDVEWAMLKYKRINEIAVISIQNDSELNDRFIFFTVGNARDDEIMEFARQELPFFWRPDEVVTLDSLPRTGRANKPDLNALRNMVK